MSFKVIPAGVPASAEEWRRAMSAPASELPSLTDTQRAEVERFSLDEDEYKRLRVLLRRFATDRQARQGQDLGNLIERLISPLGDSYRLRSVSRRGTPLGWRVTIGHEGKGIFEFQLLLAEIDALTAGRVSEGEISALRAKIFEELGEKTTFDAAS